MNERVAVTDSHLSRNAFLYIRQSSIRQIFENSESTKRQYALQERIVALGWNIENIVVIDNDLGLTGSTSVAREGFQKLVAEVSMGRAGLVAGLEVSRLARNSADWHRLLEICALMDALILDEDGLYNPTNFNDRLLLGLKGTMSEAELHVLKSRLIGGIMNKASRGELPMPLPVGFVYDSAGNVTLDPDMQVQEAIRLFFSCFQRIGSATGTVKFFGQEKLNFPRRLRKGLKKGELVWGPLVHSRALQVLHNPRYAGAFVYGRTTTRHLPNGKATQMKIPRGKWHSLIKDSHASYITWETFEDNQNILKSNAQARGRDRRMTPPREGPALLQGIAICGVCGGRMTVHYHFRQGHRLPDYVCQRKGIENSIPICQRINGESIDKLIVQIVLETVTPAAIEAALKIQQDMLGRVSATEKMKKLDVERARYHAELARERFNLVDPKNRLVADALEASWNDRLRELEKAQAEYNEFANKSTISVSDEQRKDVLKLASDLPTIWANPELSDQQRKRILRFIIDDVTMIRHQKVELNIRFKGGLTRTEFLPNPLRLWELRKTNPAIIAEIDRLLDKFTDRQAAGELNRKKRKSCTGVPFTAPIVAHLRRGFGLLSHEDRLRKRGYMSLRSLAKMLNLSYCTVQKWTSKGILKSEFGNDRGDRFYQIPSDKLIKKLERDKVQGRSKELIKSLSNRIHEVQYEA